jgi:hypothetical protein
MKLTKNFLLNCCSVSVVVCCVSGTLCAQVQTPEFDRVWTTTGSTGTVDEADVGKVFFENSKVQMGRILSNQSAVAKTRQVAGRSTQSAVIRYNVTAVDGLFTPVPPCRTEKCLGPQLTFRFIAAGSGARVVARLIEVDLATGVETGRLIIDSLGSTTTGYRTESAQPACTARWHFDFQRKAFYVEATLTTRSSVTPIGSVAGIQMIKIGFADCL